MTYLTSKEKAKEIRAQLKATFPGIKFWVTSKNSINISWIDGPTRQAVEAIANQYQSIARCEATGDILSGGNTYVFAERRYSESALKQGLSTVESKNMSYLSEIDFSAVSFNPRFDERGVQLVHKPEYTTFQYGRIDLETEVYEALKDVDFTAKTEALEVVTVVEPTEATEAPESIEPAILEDEKVQEVLEIRAERFNGRKKRRIERYEELSAKHSEVSTAAYNESKKMGDAIPFGQPILVGHHSEGRDRRYRGKIWDKMGQSVKHDATAKYYADKADAAEHNHAISSDDPEAISKIKREIEGLERNQTFMKEGNKIIKNKKLTKEEKIAALDAAGHDGNSLMNPRWHYAEGYQGYQLSNNNANINRLKKRLEQLQQDLIESVELGDTEQTYEQHGLTVVHARSINRLQLKFNGKPSEQVRSILKSNGFRWAPSEMAWQRFLNNSQYALTTTIKELDALMVLA
jgi:hypothetical protein